jgi:cytidylate kinase
MIVAIDGPSGVGKGTLARLLAAHFGWDHLDTGSLYRAVALVAMKRGVALDDSGALAGIARHLDTGHLTDPALRAEGIGQAASKVAADKAVRDALFDFQREFAAHPPGGEGAVIDGRDVGSVICPDAPVKLFLTADFETRLRRRMEQLAHQGATPDRDTVAAALKERDARDAGRAVAPLVRTADAHLLDTTNFDIDSTFQAAKAIVAACAAKRVAGPA